MKVHPIFQRLELITGSTAIQALNTTEVIIFGVGGVGSWCAESLIRSGIHHLTIVDSDVVCITNINRQLQATAKNIGRSKVMELKDRLLTINPRATIETVHGKYDDTTRDSFKLSQFDYVIDAIDSLSPKVSLIEHAYNSDTTLFSAMGAGNKMDPLQIKQNSIWKTRHCGLSKMLRKRLRKRGFSGDFQCVYSDEVPLDITHTSSQDGSHHCYCSSTVKDAPDEKFEAHDWCHTKAEINGSVAHMTIIYGNVLASMVIRNVIQKVTDLELLEQPQQLILTE
ncbi:MAG: tRNA threonylcarbamoyladenosine dehydratase [Fibrobacterales bacterium]